MIINTSNHATDVKICQVPFTLFIFKIFIDTFGTSFTCTHGKDNSSCTCNSISAGGVITELNAHILENKSLWDQVMAETLIPKWATVEEMAEWTYFLAVVNKSMTAQDVLIDNGEIAKANFVW